MARSLRLAVIGDPISHSRSPAIHTAALRSTGIEGSYVPRRVSVDQVDEVIGDLRRGELDGVNVTMPLKIAIARAVDELSEPARRAGSVNTVVRREDGSLVGHNTDITALQRLWPKGRDLPVLILGAGGAAAAAVQAAAGRSVYVSARRPASVAELAEQVESVELMAVPWGVAVVEAIVLNATPVGMQGEELPPRVVPLAAALIDLAYGPETTPAVRQARSLGIPTVDGLEFLVAQAADAFTLWTGQEAPVESMIQAARNHSSSAAGTPNHP
ncbi:MAG TPA: shikimate dehydrogenase [Acidimicrobiia bacterium]|nr:shikimate dehydrogenase [Acidimicrobiia bacterium]